MTERGWQGLVGFFSGLQSCFTVSVTRSVSILSELETHEPQPLHLA